jgi:hypothetical protein
MSFWCIELNQNWQLFLRVIFFKVIIMNENHIVSYIDSYNKIVCVSVRVGKYEIWRNRKVIFIRNNSLHWWIWYLHKLTTSYLRQIIMYKQNGWTKFIISLGFPNIAIYKLSATLWDGFIKMLALTLPATSPPVISIGRASVL